MCRSNCLSVPDHFSCFIWLHVWGNSTQTAPRAIAPCSVCTLHPLISAKEVKCQKGNTDLELNQGGGLQRASVPGFKRLIVIGNQISEKRPAALFLKREGLICSDVKNKRSCGALFVWVHVCLRVTCLYSQTIKSWDSYYEPYTLRFLTDRMCVTISLHIHNSDHPLKQQSLPKTCCTSLLCITRDLQPLEHASVYIFQWQ